MNNIIKEKGELVEVIRGVDHNHFHFKELIFWISESEILATENTLIQRGDELYFENKNFYVKDFEKSSDGYKLFKLIRK